MTAPATRHADCQLCDDIRRVIAMLEEQLKRRHGGGWVYLTYAEADTLLEVLRPLVEAGESAPAAPDYTGGGIYAQEASDGRYGHLCHVDQCSEIATWRRLDGPRGTDGRERPLYLCEEQGPREAKP